MEAPFKASLKFTTSASPIMSPRMAQCVCHYAEEEEDRAEIKGERSGGAVGCEVRRSGGWKTKREEDEEARKR